MIHRASSLDGEWEPVPIPQVDYGQTMGSGQWSTGLDNPAPIIRPDGSVAMLVKNYPAFTIWVATASKYHEPYKLVQDAGMFSPSRNGDFKDEDPCIWQDHRGNYHAFFHDHRGHAFSEDGLKWMWGSDNSWDGGHLVEEGYVGDIYDTERPRIYVNPETRRPELLFYATGGIEQPTSVGKGAIGFTVVRKIGDFPEEARAEQAFAGGMGTQMHEELGADASPSSRSSTTSSGSGISVPTGIPGMGGTMQNPSSGGFGATAAASALVSEKAKRSMLL